jgi:hypothetical protein
MIRESKSRVKSPNKVNESTLYDLGGSASLRGNSNSRLAGNSCIHCDELNSLISESATLRPSPLRVRTLWLGGELPYINGRSRTDEDPDREIAKSVFPILQN